MPGARRAIRRRGATHSKVSNAPECAPYEGCPRADCLRADHLGRAPPQPGTARPGTTKPRRDGGFLPGPIAVTGLEERSPLGGNLGTGPLRRHIQSNGSDLPLVPECPLRRV
ncbi:hypothetical protein SLA_7301 [Streptomyces laurentii]|uniref:Uncharacterized protein n=1 Tax=Streptomyces laurentii TaxID=39478 RepID=A0A169PLK5_STRLU|nr:hypothetical protein SLA_7301 [Streptomyces laurentii]